MAVFLFSYLSVDIVKVHIGIVSELWSCSGTHNSKETKINLPLFSAHLFELSDLKIKLQ